MEDLEDILMKLFVLLVVLALLGALAYDDRRTRRIRQAEDRAAAEAAAEGARKHADAEP